MNGILRNLVVIGLLFLLQSLQAQRRTQGTQSTTPVSPGTQFTPLTHAHLENTLNKLGIELGQTLAQAKTTIENNGGEVLWTGSPDPNFVRTKKELQRGKEKYFRYVAHSIRGDVKRTSMVQTMPYSAQDITLFIDVYPKSEGDLKDPDNLIIYRIQTSLGFQPTHHQMTYSKIKPVQVSYAEFHAVMETQGHSLYQSGGGLLVYKKDGGKSIDIGDLTAARRIWKKIMPTKSPCNKLQILADNFPVTASNMINGMAEPGADTQPVIHYKPWGSAIDKHQGDGAFQTYKDCGSATILQISQIDNPENAEKPLLNTVSLFYQNAALIDEAFEGFYNALYKN